MEILNMLSCKRILMYSQVRCLTITCYNLSKKGRNVTAQQWLHRQVRDPYVKRAQVESHRCRSAFKLIEINDKFSLFQPGQVVIDCGAAPGSWSEVAVKEVNANNAGGSTKKGAVIGVDLQHMEPVEGATILYNSDFKSIETQQKILQLLKGQNADIVMSDMAPNATGVKSLDHELIIDLCTSALKFSLSVLKDGGQFLGKIWQGYDQARLESLMKIYFQTVRVVKPNASRDDSAEVFLLARHFNKTKKQ